MRAARTTKTRRNTLTSRIPSAERNLIDRAAESAGKTRKAFILEAALHAAEEVLLDNALMAVDPEAQQAFQNGLGNLAQPNERLRRTMQSKFPWNRA